MLEQERLLLPEMPLLYAEREVKLTKENAN